MTLHVTDIKGQTDIELTASLPSSKTGLYRDGLKRLVDTTLILIASPIVVPLVLTLCALVFITDRRNPFYSQQRVGRGGRHFRMWKLRTMIPNADALLVGYLAENPVARAEWNATQKLKRDPRITRIGAALRKSSLDELPQLWNVLNGTMSLVGPRPMMVEQQGLYHGSAYYSLRPGITGPWQITERNESDFVERVEHDNWYDKNISLRTDVSILRQTVGVVMRCTGY